MRPAAACDRALDHDDDLRSLASPIIEGAEAPADLAAWVNEATQAVEGELLPGEPEPLRDDATEEERTAFLLAVLRNNVPLDPLGRVVSWMAANPRPGYESLSRDAYEFLAPYVGPRLRAAWEVARRGDEPTPSWVSFPVLQLGPLPKQVPPLVALRYLSDDTTPADRIAAMLEARCPDGLLELRRDGWMLRAEVPDLLRAVEERTAEHLRDLQMEAPDLSVELVVPQKVTESFAVRLEALDNLTAEVVPLAALSAAQQRWLTIAATLATSELLTVDGLEENSEMPAQGDDDRADAEADSDDDQEWELLWPTAAAVLLDEPDANLHGAARAHVPAALASLGADRQMPIIVATHAAEFLAEENARLVHVSRTGIGSRLADITTVLNADRLAALGLTRSEALAVTRVFVVVEGQHDRAVLQGWLADDYLTPARARILAMRGDYNLMAIVDAELLFEGTDAAVLVVLDDQTGYAQLGRAWQATRDLAAEHSRDKAWARLQRERGRLAPRRRGDELSASELLLELMFAALKARQEARLDVGVLTTRDICQQLPITAFPGAGVSWAQFDERCRREAGGDVKAFLGRLTGQRVEPTMLTELVAQHRPSTEIQRLGQRVLTTRRAWAGR
jgi:energy-coupling factor transporter ATP-binding protein EcfA2